MRISSWRRNLAAVLLGQTLSGLAISFIMPFIPLYVQFLGVDGTEEAARWAGMIGSVAAVSMGLAQPFWGSVADRWGRKPMLVRSLVGSGIVIVMMGAASSPEQLLLLRFLQGGVTGSGPAANALISASTPKVRLGFVLGMLQVAWLVGASLGPLVGGLLADTLGYRMAFYVSGLMAILGGLVAAVVRENFTPPPRDVPRPSVLGQSRSLLAIPAFRIVLSVLILCQLGSIIVSPVLSLFIAELGRGANAATIAGTVLAVTGAGSAVAAITIGRLGDRVGYTVILRVCLIGAAVTYLPQAFVQEVWQLLGLRLLLGLFLGGLMPTVNALVAVAAPADRRGAAYGLTETANQVAFVIGPLAGAGIASLWSVRAVFLATSVLYGLAWTGASLSFGKVRFTASEKSQTRAG